MAMSWGWTPLCRIGNDRYRINATNEQSAHPSVVLPSSQCGIVPPPQLPAGTSIVLSSSNQQGVSSSSLHPPSSSRTPVTSSSSSGFNTSQAATYHPAASNAEERVVRRSPRLARTTSKVTCSYDDDLQSGRSQIQWNNTVTQQNMWKHNSIQSNSNNQQINKNYSVYNYEGQITPCVNTNNSVSIIYNNNRSILSNVSQASRYPPIIPFAKSSLPSNSIKLPSGKVSIKTLDFYEVITTLVQEEIILEGIGPSQRTYSFVLNSVDIKNLQDKKRKPPYLILLRFCKLDFSCEQNDYYPNTHQVAVNHRLVLLPGLETMPRGAMRPMDVTNYCQMSHLCNFVTVRCLESCKLYVCVVQKYTSQDLLSRLEARLPIKEEDTVNDIKKKLEVDQTDEGIAAATLQFSLLCPLSRIRIKLPCRASTCIHLQCFDAATYLQLNECKPKWSCPVCYQAALYKNLVIDGYFQKIINENTDTDKVELHPDGTWTLVDGVKKKQQLQGTDCTLENTDRHNASLESGDKTVVLDSDDDAPAENATSGHGSQVKTNSSPVVPSRRTNSPEVVTLSDDESPGGESPQVTASTYPVCNSTNVETTTIAETNNITIEDHIDYFKKLWGGAISTQYSNSYTGFHPLEHSNNLYIPLSRTPIPPHLSSSITITRKSNECRTNSSDRACKSPNSGSRGLQDKFGTSKTVKSKSKKIRKIGLKHTHKTKSGDVTVRHKRRRILNGSSNSSDSESDHRKKSSSESSLKQKKKQKRKHKRRISNSSGSDKSSASSSLSKKSSVNLISSSDSSLSSSSSSSSSSSDSSKSNDTDQSNNSFVSEDASAQPETSSRVLRSAIQRQKKKKK